MNVLARKVKEYKCQNKDFLTLFLEDQMHSYSYMYINFMLQFFWHNI